MLIENSTHRTRLRRGGDGVYRARYAPTYEGCLVRQMRDGRASRFPGCDRNASQRWRTVGTPG